MTDNNLTPPQDNNWISDRYHNKSGPSNWFRSKYGHKVKFQSSNNDKNERQPVLDIRQFDREYDAKCVASEAKEYWSGYASVRLHKRVTKVDSIEMRRWFVITRAYPDRRDLPWNPRTKTVQEGA